ncbi:VanZ family protein [Virgibacillus doumboii]|uniref:VanZ family protein n=1 Tax=Virgibacillus doumboii TaxID=2697503 RepID=UPI0013DF7633|nr:VanZ family protein [Virgibacillus doumboii]
MHYIQSLPIYFILLSLIFYIPVRYSFLQRKGIKIEYYKELICILWIIYLESLLYLTIFPSGHVIHSEWVGVNLVPFDTIEDYLFLFSHGYMSTAIINLIGNIIVFIPLGILLVLLNKKITPIKMITIGFGSTLTIETTQLVFSMSGLLSRSFDIDDLILNTLGVIIGYTGTKIALYIINHIKPPSSKN